MSVAEKPQLFVVIPPPWSLVLTPAVCPPHPGCNRLTDTCLKYLRRLSCISLVDLRGCRGVSRKACEAFISELSVNSLYCLSDEKLIQRIS